MVFAIVASLVQLIRGSVEVGRDDLGGRVATLSDALGRKLGVESDGVDLVFLP